MRFQLSLRPEFSEVPALVLDQLGLDDESAFQLSLHDHHKRVWGIKEKSAAGKFACDLMSTSVS
jgi:hypothetical protein